MARFWARKPSVALAAAASIALAAVVIMTQQAPANAAVYTSSDHSACHGALRRSIAAAPYAELDVYWEASTGMNCAMMVHTGAAYNKPAKTSVSITRLGKSAGSTVTATNRGTFRFYAGGVRVKARGVCISATGTMEYKGHIEAHIRHDLCG